MIKASIFIIFPAGKFYSNKASQSCNSFRSENTFLGDFTGTSLWQDSFVLGKTAWSLQRTRRCLSLNPGHPTATQMCDPPHHATCLQQAIRAARNAQPETIAETKPSLRSSKTGGAISPCSPERAGTAGPAGDPRGGGSAPRRRRAHWEL